MKIKPQLSLFSQKTFVVLKIDRFTALFSTMVNIYYKSMSTICMW